MFGFWKQMTFGNYLKFLIEFIEKNGSLLGLILFSYVIVIFIGRFGGLKYIRDRFEEFVISKSRELLQANKNLKTNELVDKVYEEWKNEIDKFPSYIYIQSKRDYWIEKPSVEGIEQRLKLNKEKANELLIKNGVIIGE